MVERGDMWSRWVSLLALAAGLSALGIVLYRGYQDQRSDIPVPALEEKLAELDRELDDRRTQLSELGEKAKVFDGDLESALETFRADAQQLQQRLEQEEVRARAQRESAFQEKLAAIAASGEHASQSASGVEHTTPASTLSPELRLVQTTLRAASEDWTWLTIRNQGELDAQITRVTFTPQSDFPTTSSNADETPPELGSRQYLVAFGPEHNESRNPDRHGVYERLLDRPIVVPASSEVSVKVMIRNARHLTWGLVGELVLDYGGAEPLLVPNARVVFTRDS